MVDGYPQERLGEFASVQGGFAFRSGDFKDSGVPVLKIKNVRIRDVNTSELDYVDEEVAKGAMRYYCKTGDLLISMTGSGPQAPNSVVGRVARFTGSSDKFLINQRVGRFIIKQPSKLDPRYLFFVLTREEYQRYLVSTATGSANQANISGSQIENLEIPIPTISEQRAIAAVLGALDDKIELNRRMNETLEALAQSLFKSWFVDATQSGLPKGWRETTLDELAAISGGKQLPTEECKPSGKFTVFGANGIMGYADRSTHEEFVIAFGRVGAYCGSIHWAHDGAWINNNASSVVPHRWPEFVLQAMLNVDFAAMRTGSAQPFIPNSALSAAKIIRPTDDILDSYCSVVHPLRLKQTQNVAESRTLAALRDALLPKLLSGELRLPSHSFDTASVPAAAQVVEAKA